MSDSDIIKKAYEDLVQQAFESYWEDSTLENPTPQQIQDAETKFKLAILDARRARDRAIALLPP